jgi:hypothetical protein
MNTQCLSWSPTITMISSHDERTTGPDEVNEPPHVVKNRYIIRGYRVHNTYTEAIRDTWFMLPPSTNNSIKQVPNNETANVWSCVIGFIAHLILFIYINSVHSHPVFWISLSIVLFQCNMILTAAYHTFLSIPRMYTLWSALDLVGISIALVGMEICLASHGFQVYGNVWITLIAMIGVTSYTVFRRLKTQQESPLWLLIVFVGAQGLLVLPMYPIGEYVQFGRLSALCVLSCISILLGLVSFVSKFPERVFRSRFDYVCHSHVNWHILYMLCFMLFFIDVYNLKLW